MGIQVAQFIEDQLKKAGVEVTEETRALLATKGLDQIPEELVAGIEKGLISIENAKQHTEVRSHAQGELAAAVERKLKSIYVDVLEKTPEQWAEFRGPKENGKYSKNITAVTDELGEEVKNWKGEIIKKNQGKSAEEIRKELDAEYKSKLEDLGGKLNANVNTISDYENRFKNQQKEFDTQLATVQTSSAEKILRMQINDRLRNLPYQSKLTEDKEYLNFRLSKIIDSTMNNPAFIVREEAGELKLFSKSDPVAPAMTDKNVPLQLMDFLTEASKDMLDPNGGKGGGGDPAKPGFNPTKLPGGNGQPAVRKLPNFGI